MARFPPGGCPEGGPSTSHSWHLVGKWEQNKHGSRRKSPRRLGKEVPLWRLGVWDRREAETHCGFAFYPLCRAGCWICGLGALSMTGLSRLCKEAQD